MEKISIEEQVFNLLREPDGILLLSSRLNEVANQNLEEVDPETVSLLVRTINSLIRSHHLMAQLHGAVIDKAITERVNRMTAEAADFVTKFNEQLVKEDYNEGHRFKVISTTGVSPHRS